LKPANILNPQLKSERPGRLNFDVRMPPQEVTAISTGIPCMATILIVEDLSADRQFIVTLLRAEGHRLLEAADGGEGILVAQAEHPDLVIADVVMPMMSGYEFVNKLSLDQTTRGIPVLFYSVPYSEREARAFALARPPGPLTADHEQQLETVRKSAKHLLSLVNGLLSRKSRG
jgi:CheY-like chemotaxis protein